MSNTYTTNTRLAKPGASDRGWGTTLNANADVLDALAPVGGLVVAPTEQPSTTLNVRVAAGRFVRSTGVEVSYGGTASQALTASTTSYLYLTDAASPVLTVNTTGFPAAGTPHLPLATVATGASSVALVTDRRPAFACVNVSVSGAPTTATYITQTADATLSNEQALSTLATGLLKVTTATGVLSTASAGVDYAAAAHVHSGADITSGTVAVARLPVMTGDMGSGGTAGLVPAPAAGQATLFLRGDGTWVAAGSGGGSGTVTSVALALPAAVFAISGSPVTASGTLTGSFQTQTANLVFAGPTTGTAAAPTFRALVAADIPSLDAAVVTTGTFAAARLPAMVGDAGSGGTKGAVPAPAAGDAAKFLKGDGTWGAPAGSGTVTSVAMTVPSGLSVAGSPITSTGTFAVTTTLSGILKGTGSGFAAAVAGTDYAAASHVHSGADITTGTVAAARLPAMGASGVSHAAGLVPDPGASAGTTRFLREDATWVASGGSGTVTSVALALPSSTFTISGSPVTTSGTLTGTFATQSQNTFLGGPGSGIAATPTWRLLVEQDLPSFNASKVNAGVFAVARGGTGLSTITSGKMLYASATDTLAALTLGSTLVIGSGTLDVVGNTTNQKVIVSKAGTTVGTRKQVNLIEGSGVTLTVADNSGSDRVDVTVASTVGGLYVATAATTVANSGGETSIVGTGVGSLTLPANFWTVGRTVRLRARGSISNSGTPQLTINVKVGTTPICSTGAITTATGLSGAGWTAEVEITCLTTGSTGSVIGQGEFTYDTGTTGAFEGMVGSSATINTLSSGTLDLTVTWGTPSASNTITRSILVVESIF